MTQEEKQLLLKDISARLPYKVLCSITKKGVVRELKPMNNGISMPVNQVCDVTLIKTLNTDIINDFGNDNIVLKPYLRSMSRMTEEEKEDLKKEHLKDEKLYAECLTNAANGDDSMRGKVIPHFAADWCNKYHFDYRGLIPMGLALEAPNHMFKFD